MRDMCEFGCLESRAVCEDLVKMYAKHVYDIVRAGRSADSCSRFCEPIVSNVAVDLNLVTNISTRIHR